MVSMDSSTRKAIGELDGLIDTRAALLSWEESLAAPYDGREVWVHSDLKPNNLLVSAEGRLTAVIDFETCGVGDPACDLFPVWYLLPANVRDEFRAALDVDDVTWLRGRGRVLSQALGYPRRGAATQTAVAGQQLQGQRPRYAGYAPRGDQQWRRQASRRGYRRMPRSCIRRHILVLRH